MVNHGNIHAHTHLWHTSLSLPLSVWLVWEIKAPSNPILNWSSQIKKTQNRICHKTNGDLCYVAIHKASAWGVLKDLLAFGWWPALTFNLVILCDGGPVGSWWFQRPALCIFLRGLANAGLIKKDSRHQVYLMDHIRKVTPCKLTFDCNWNSLDVSERRRSVNSDTNYWHCTWGKKGWQY